MSYDVFLRRELLFWAEGSRVDYTHVKIFSDVNLKKNRD